MSADKYRLEGYCLLLFLKFLLLVLASLAEWAALTHFNLIGLGWAYWRAGVIAAVIYLLIVYVRAKKGDYVLLWAVLIGMLVPWMLFLVVTVGYILIVWHTPEFKDLDFSSLGLCQIAFNAMGAILAVKTWLQDD